MFSMVRAKVNGLDEKQSKYVDAVMSGKSEAQARDIAGYKAAPRSEAVQKAIAGEPVGDWSSAALDYAFRLAVERISGEPLDEGHETWAMRRGHELEPHARMNHELESGLIVEEAGFAVTDDGVFGASADGLIGSDEGAEYKCFVAPDKLRSFWFDNDASDVMDQVQGGMWITGRKRWHLCLYCPALEPVGKQLWWKVFDRDDDYIDKMVTDLLDFKDLVDRYEQKLRMKEAA
ncbi:recombinase [Pusillimonas caeni]|nr:recombinase [Pusillimonas caeni]